MGSLVHHENIQIAIGIGELTKIDTILIVLPDGASPIGYGASRKIQIGTPMQSVIWFAAQVQNRNVLRNDDLI